MPFMHWPEVFEAAMAAPEPPPETREYKVFSRRLVAVPAPKEICVDDVDEDEDEDDEDDVASNTLIIP